MSTQPRQLTIQDAIEIRQSSAPSGELAAHYGVPIERINAVRRREAFADIDVPPPGSPDLERPRPRPRQVPRLTLAQAMTVWQSKEPDEDLDLDYVPLEAKDLAVNGHPAIGISNSFGFGGHNVVICLEAAA